MTTYNDLDNLDNFDDINELYKFIVGESIKSIDIIKKHYPTLESDTTSMKHVAVLKENNPELTQDELTSHAFAFMILIHLMNCVNK